ncbi:MAG: hypothetical protein K2X87_10015 [Gemmataceae bacterium]|nr:hypothetical protein [Gemmataceae bacterium]
MGTVILDAELKAKLNGLNEPLDLRDPDGRLVGRFVPVDPELRAMYDWAREEFARQEAEDAANGVTRTWDGKSGKTTAEAIAYLERLGREGAAGQ